MNLYYNCNMRAILNISIPEKEKWEIERRAKKAKQTVSGYIFSIITFANNMIQEDELVDMAKQADKDYRTGKAKKLKSLSDLI